MMIQRRPPSCQFVKGDDPDNGVIVELANCAPGSVAAPAGRLHTLAQGGGAFIAAAGPRRQ